VFAGGSATYLSQPPVPVVFLPVSATGARCVLTGDASACAFKMTVVRQFGPLSYFSSQTHKTLKTILKRHLDWYCPKVALTLIDCNSRHCSFRALAEKYPRRSAYAWGVTHSGHSASPALLPLRRYPRDSEAILKPIRPQSTLRQFLTGTADFMAERPLQSRRRGRPSGPLGVALHDSRS
jgi:hypothetical protein